MAKQFIKCLSFLGLLTVGVAKAASSPATCTITLVNDITNLPVNPMFMLVDISSNVYKAGLEVKWPTSILKPQNAITFTTNSAMRCDVGESVLGPNVHLAIEWVDRQDPQTPYHSVDFTGTLSDDNNPNPTIKLSQLQASSGSSNISRQLKPIAPNP